MQSRALGEAMAIYLTAGAWPGDLDLDELTEARFAPGRRRLGEKMYV
jgi:hypothetical protein